MSESGGEPQIDWRRRAARAEGSLRAALRDQLGTELATLINAAIALSRAKRSGAPSDRRRMSKRWQDLHDAVDAVVDGGVGLPQ